jgi:acyl-CoA thioester hydrolase
MISSTKKIRVRYGEVDRMGYLHHGNYPLYLEEGRTELMRQFGLSYREMEDRGVLLPVRDLSIKYLQPALYDDEVVVTTVLAKKPGVKISFDYTIYNSSGVLLCEAKATLVFVDAKSRKPIRAPGFFEELIAPFFK